MVKSNSYGKQRSPTHYQGTIKVNAFGSLPKQMKRTMSATMQKERILLDMDKDDEFFCSTDEKYNKGHPSSVYHLKMKNMDFETPAPRRERPCEEIKETDNDMTTTFGNVTSTQNTNTFIADKLMMSENVTGV